MKTKSAFTVAGFIYVTYALLTAYFALGRIEAAHQIHPAAWEVEPKGLQLAPVDYQPVDQVDAPSYANVSREYRIEVWIGRNCGWCDKFKAKELPKIKKAGVKVEIKKAWKDKPPRDLRVVPTIKIYRRLKCIKTYHGYEKAETILKNVKKKALLLR